MQPLPKKTSKKDFIYKVRDETGKTFCGLTESTGERAIKRSFRSSSLYFIRAWRFNSKKLYARRVSLDTLMMFTHRLYSLIEAGIPILSALNILWRQTEDLTMQLVTSRLILQVEGGESLSEAIGKFPNIFPNIYIAMVSVGESGAGLVPLFKELSKYLEAQKQFISRAKKATIYPSIVLFIATLVMMFMFVFVVPTFERVLRNINVELPLVTKILMAVSDAIRTVYFPIIVLVVAAAAYHIHRVLMRVPAFLRLMDSAKLRVPVLGEIIYTLCMSRFVRSLSLLTGAGLQIIRSLDIAKTTIGNQKIYDGVNEMEEQISQGASLYVAFKSTPIFPIIMLEMIGVAEQRGNFSEVLEKLANHFDEKADYLLSRFLIILEPVLIIFVGGIVAFILMGVYLPIFSIWKGFAG